MNTFKCNYCNTMLGNKSSLKLHQNTAKYCLKIQLDNNEKKEFFNCDYCLKKLSTKQNLQIHLKSCKVIKKDNVNHLEQKIQLEKQLEQQKIQYEKQLEQQKIQYEDKLEQQKIQYEDKLEQLEKQLEKFQDTIERLALRAIDKPTTTTTTNNLNITTAIDFNDTTKIKELLNDDYNINYIIDGQKGIAKFVVDKLLKDEDGKLLYICTDPSRQIFKYKDNKGEIKKDVEAKKLTNYIVNSGIKKKTIDIANEWCKDDYTGKINMDKFDIMINPQQSILKINDDNNSFKKELVTLTT